MPMAITQSNRVAPWIGIGVQGQWDNSLEALQAADMDFTVRREQLYWQREDKQMPQYVYNEPVPMFANVRDDTDQQLGCVTKQYKVVQNVDAFSIIDPFVQGNNGVITNVGMTEDGLCFMVARVQVERTIGGEPYEINLMATNSFNTRYPCQVILTPVRIYCQNMYRKLVNDRVFLAKHTTTANDRLIRIANSNAVEKKVLLFSDVVDQYQSKRMPSRQFQALVAMLFPYPKEGGPRETTYRAKVDEQRERFEDQYFNAQDNQVHKDSAFGFVNAYFDWLSHRSPAKNMGGSWTDRRLDGLVSGVDVKGNVLKEALR